MPTFLVGVSLLTLGLLCLVAYVYYKYRVLLGVVQQEKRRAEQRAYEIAILKELGDRIGYSLDIRQIVDVITGSLHQFIEYTAVAYMLVDPETLLFKVDLESSVHRGFIDELKNRMQQSLGALLDNESLTEQHVQEVLTGAILVDDFQTPIKSIFNIPLVINDKVVGILTIADTTPDRYHEEEMTMLYKITNQASRAVTKLETVVESEKQKLNAMVFSMKDGVVMTDSDFRIVIANPVARSIVGKRLDEPVRIFDYIDVLASKFDIRGRLEESVERKEVFTSERIRIGDTFYVIKVLPVFGSAEEMLGSVVVFHNVTHDVEIERLREDFTSMLVHELRSPLNGIKGIIEVLRSGKVEIDEQKESEYLSMMYQSSVQMLGLVNDILDVAKVESGAFEVYREPTDVRSVLHDRVLFYETAAADGGITLREVVDDALPESLDVDPRGIAQIYNNLISNALKFTEHGGAVTAFAMMHTKDESIMDRLGHLGLVLPNKTDALDRNPDGVVLGVLDTGLGIPADEIPMLFDRYRQASTARRKSGKKGTGLGLAIVKGVAEGHGGTVRVVSKERAGTAFIVYIPTASTPKVVQSE